MKVTAATFIFVMLLSGTGRSRGRGAHFLRFETGARATAMGGAAAAFTGDTSALWYNPASVGPAGFSNLFLAHNEAGEGMRRGAAAFLYPSEPLRGTLAVFSGYYHSGDIDAYTPDGMPAGSVSAYAFSPGIAYSPKIFSPLYPGISLKILHEKLDTYSATSMAADAGILWKTPAEGLRLGASLLNIGNGMRFIKKRSPLPLAFRAGATREFEFAGAELEVGVNMTAPAGESSYISAGAEVLFHRLIALRTGWTGKDDLSNGIRLGGGLLTRDITLDYAWVPGGRFDDSHRLSLSFTFGDGYREAALEAEIRQHFEKCERYYRAGRILDAYREFRNLLLVAPRHREAEEYLSLIEVSVESTEVKREIENTFKEGKNRFEKGDLTSARAAFEDILLLYSAHKGALEYIDLIENRFREVSQTITDRATEHYERLEFGKAREEAEKALAIDPENKSAEEIYREASLRIRELEERRAALERERRERVRQRNITALIQRGESHLGSGRWAEAAESFGGALELDPGNDEAKAGKAGAYINLAREKRDEGNLPEALENYRKAEEYGAEDIAGEKEEIVSNMRDKAAELNRRGLIEYSRGDLHEAESLWEEALRHNPDLREAAENLNRVRRELEE